MTCRRNGRWLIAALCGIALLASPIASKAQTTAEIVKRGKVRIGVLIGSPPMGMVDATGNPIGYDVDTANLIAKYMGVPVELTPLTPPARIPALQAGKVDFLVSTLAPTPQRALTVDFTQPYNAFQMAIVGKKSATLKSLDDLKNKSIGVNRGSSQESALQRITIPGIKITRFEDDSTVLQALISGQIESAAMPETVMIDYLKTRADADVESKFIFFQQPNSIAVRKGSDELRLWLNDTIYFMKVSGELDEIARKWTGAGLPNMPVF
ncbi:MAG: transporter substrate-binding domain-containing protein [Pseudomonadota bacterium]|nr:transporter substrate-binding domain-containing protein [Pseudomonadota bacterium]